MPTTRRQEAIAKGEILEDNSKETTRKGSTTRKKTTRAQNGVQQARGDENGVKSNKKRKPKQDDLGVEAKSGGSPAKKAKKTTNNSDEGPSNVYKTG